ncbi:MAG: phosphoserine phosphatase SerB [Gammaproteobacteria bacterium]|jgi:phosphoserine phosphatase
MREILLLNIFAPARGSLVAELSEMLAGHEVEVLDINQTQIHEQVNVGLLVRMGDDVEMLVDQILRATAAMNATANVSRISPESYAEWVSEQGKPRYIITLLARRISADQLHAVTACIAARGLDIDDVRRLSGRIALEARETSAASVEFSVRGALEDQGSLRSELLSIATALSVDISVQEDNVYRRNRRLVAFDMDSTLIEAEIIDELARAKGVGDEVAAITESAMRGEMDFAESFRRRVSLLEGLKESALADVARSVTLTEGAERLVRTLSAHHFKTAILSGGFQYVGERLRERLGIDYVYANRIEVKDGRVTGRVLGDVVDGDRKAELLREIAAHEGISLEQVIAVGDGANDLPMLSIAGLGIAFRAKPIVKQSARHAISNLGLDGILYLLGFTERDILV